MDTVKEWLLQHKGSDFTGLGIKDESNGRWVLADKVLNKHLVRHLKEYFKLHQPVGEIGDYLYHECKDLLDTHGYWTNEKDQVVFWYSWR